MGQSDRQQGASSRSSELFALRQRRGQSLSAHFRLAGLTDPRVTYWEPAKWIARLRALNTSDNLVLLKTNMEAGHGGASGRFDSLKDTALSFAFALKVAGLA